MIYSSTEYAEALYLSIRDKSDSDTKKAMTGFVASMEKRGLIALLPEVLKAMPAAIKKVEGTEDVLVETAHGISEKMTAEAVRAIGKEADEVEITSRVNPELLGGVRVRGKDMLYDATLKDRLNRLNDAFRTS